jgi:peptidyl-tRNA hydrolase, PTH1 family
MQTASVRWIVVGLGNPGEEYQATRHNIGAMLVDHLASTNGVGFSRHKSRNDVADLRLSSGSILVLTKPHSYMNTLGSNVRALCDFYSVTAAHVIACHDELDIDFATLRLKFGGGENGHNGLKSMTSSLGTNEYFRLRLGIGRPPGRQDPADFVLRRFASSEREELPQFLDRAADALLALIEDGLQSAQSKFNS